MHKNKLNAYFRLMRMDKPVGVYLLLWPTVWALLLAANGLPPLPIIVVFVLGVFVMRSAGCVINDYADRKIDGEVLRTTNRPIVSGEVTETEALGLFAVLIVIAFGLVLSLNWQTILLSFAALALASVYPFMKRYTHLPQVVLGAAFSWAIPMAFMAVKEDIPNWSWWLYLANLLWTVAYDTQYAMVDRDDDLKIGVKSTAILFGKMDKLAIGLLQFCSLAILFYLANLLVLSWVFYVALMAVALLFLYQQWLIKDRLKANCFNAFLNNHYAGMLIAIGLGFHYFI